MTRFAPAIICESRFGRWCLLALVATPIACGETPIDVVDPVSPEGVWQVTVPGSLETTLRLADDGTFNRVVANLSGSGCSSSSGTWRVNGDALVLQTNVLENEPGTATETFTLSVDGSTLSLTDGSGTVSFAAAGAMVSCVDYGFGSWTGSFTAEVDGTPVTFSDLEVRIDVDAGELEISADAQACDGCAGVPIELVLRVDTNAGALEARAYTVQNVPGATNTLFGLYHPEPGSTSFSGFDTTRLSPPGTLSLSDVGAERAAGTFSFRGNPRVEGEMASGGATFVEVEEGRIDLVYR